MVYTVSGVTQHAVDIDGTRIAYRMAGQGPAVLLLHGLGASWLTWARNIPALAERYTVYAPDLPGHGDSPDAPIRRGTGPELLCQFLQQAGVEQAAVIGNSLGGHLALQLALAHPEMVSKLALVASAGLGQEVSWYLRLSSVRGLGELLHQRRLITVDRLARVLFERPERIDPALLAALHHTRVAQTSRRTLLSIIRMGVGVRGLNRHSGLIDQLGNVQCPLLVVWGKKDRILPVSQAYAVQRQYPHAAVHIIPDAGHWPHMEEPSLFNRLALEFLELE